MPATASTGLHARQRWMAALAKAPPEELQAAWEKLGDPPSYRFLRPPETGLVMVRGRAGGTGSPFNLGEMTITRCTIQTADGATGCAFVAGRSARHAEMAALFDALLQDPQRQASILQTVIAPLVQGWQRKKTREKEKAALTRVQFFTLVRGE